jgi:hypothetical protein
VQFIEFKNKLESAFGANVIKLFMAIVYEFSLETRALVRGKLFQPIKTST